MVTNLQKTLRLHLKYLVLTGAQTSLTAQLESRECLATISVTPVRRATWIKSKVSFNFYHHERIVLILRSGLIKSIDINETDEYGYTGLHLASEHGHLKVVEELMVAETERGIDTAKDDGKRKTREELIREIRAWAPTTHGQHARGKQRL